MLDILLPHVSDPFQNYLNKFVVFIDVWPNCSDIISIGTPALFKIVENECLAKFVVGTLSSLRSSAIRLMYLFIVLTA